MKPFMDADFLLQTDTAKTLYHEAAEKMPIFDYHNHLNPQEILEDRQMENLTRVWLACSLSSLSNNNYVFYRREQINF